VHESGARSPVLRLALIVGDGEHAQRIVRRDPVDQRKRESREHPSAATGGHRPANLRAFGRDRDHATELDNELCAETWNAEGVVLSGLSYVGERIRMKRDRAL
jgi:hypothetical protein